MSGWARGASWAGGLALGALVFLAPVLAGFSAGGHLGLRLVALLAAGAWLAQAGLSGRLRLPPTRVLLPALALPGWYALAAFSSPERYGGAQLAFDLGLAVLVLLAAYALARPGWAGWALAGAGAVCGVYGLLQPAGLGLLAGPDEARATGFFYNSNHYSGFLVLAAPALLGLGLAARGPARGAWLALAGLLGVNLVLSLSWGLLALVVALLLMAGRWGWAGLGLLAVGAVLAVGLGPRPQPSPLLERAGAFVADSLGSRAMMNGASLEIVRRHPWLGVGPGQYPQAFTAYRPARITDVPTEILHKRVNYAHNDFAQVAAEAGVPALLAFAGLWGGVLLTPARDKAAWGLKTGLLALLLHGLSDANLTYVWANALLACALAGVLVSMGEDDGIG